MCLCLERMHDRRSLSALKLLKVCKDSNIHLYFSLDHFLLQCPHTEWEVVVILFLFTSFYYLFFTLPFFPLHKQTKALLPAVCLYPRTSYLIQPPTPPSAVLPGERRGNGYYCCYDNRWLCPFHKNKLRMFLKKATAPHFSSRAFRENMSTDQDGVTREYRASLFLFKCLKIQQGHSLHFMNAGLFLMSAVYKRRTRFYLNVERSVTGDDLKEVVSKQELPDGCKKLKLKAAKERDKS